MRQTVRIGNSGGRLPDEVVPIMPWMDMSVPKAKCVAAGRVYGAEAKGCGNLQPQAFHRATQNTCSGKDGRGAGSTDVCRVAGMQIAYKHFETYICRLGKTENAPRRAGEIRADMFG